MLVALDITLVTYLGDFLIYFHYVGVYDGDTHESPQSRLSPRYAPENYGELYIRPTLQGFGAHYICILQL